MNVTRGLWRVRGEVVKGITNYILKSTWDTGSEGREAEWSDDGRSDVGIQVRVSVPDDWVNGVSDLCWLTNNAMTYWGGWYGEGVIYSGGRSGWLSDVRGPIGVVPNTPAQWQGSSAILRCMIEIHTFQHCHHILLSWNMFPNPSELHKSYQSALLQWFCKIDSIALRSCYVETRVSRH